MMLPVCSAASTCSSYHQISFNVGTRILYPFRKPFEEKCIFSVGDGNVAQGLSFRTYGSTGAHGIVLEQLDQSDTIDSSIFSPYRNEFDDIVREFSNGEFDEELDNFNNWARETNDVYRAAEDPQLLDNSSSYGLQTRVSDFGVNAVDSGNDESLLDPLKSIDEELPFAAANSGIESQNFRNSLGHIPNDANSMAVDDTTSSVSESTVQASDTLEETSKGILSLKEGVTGDASMGSLPENTVQASSTLEETSKSIMNLNESFQQFLSEMKKSAGTSIEKAEGAATKTIDSLKSSVMDKIDGAKESLDNAAGNFFSSLDSTKGNANGSMIDFTNRLGQSMSRSGTVAVEILRRVIVTAEESLGNVAKGVGYYYGAAKSFLPPDVKDALNFSEEKVSESLRPLGGAFQKAYILLEGLEKSIGLDPSDPVVPFVLLLGSSATIGITYWWLNYGGYSGNLDPELTVELLKKGDAVLIDVRPEDLRVRDGIPDLRRAARSKYASISIPEVDNSLRKQLKNGREVDDALVAILIRNMKIVKNESKVIVMDANGGQSKAIARYLKRLGIKKPYLVRGGFQSWAKSGLRIKEARPETALTVLNEEAEAILEEIRPTPPLVIGYCLAASLGVYAIIEWEKTLQLIGLLGIGQTLYRRIASYEDSEDLKQDLRMLLTPVTVGAQAFSWAAGKLEADKLGLPTSPSSTAVQDRVLQAAAKHESQPSDDEETQVLPREPTSENLDLSEA